VRFEGCARPQRVAVVVHPASCNAVELPCDCGCCC
jgi:phage-related tail fiber protein